MKDIFSNFYFQEHHVPFWRVLMKISFCSDPIPKLSLHLNRFDNKRWMTSMGTSCSPPSCLKPPSARKDRSASGFMSIWYQHLELTKLKFYDIEGQNWVIVSQYFKSFKYFNNMLVTTSLSVVRRHSMYCNGKRGATQRTCMKKGGHKATNNTNLHQHRPWWDQATFV